MPESPYTSANFDPSREPIRNSARLVVPIVVDQLQPGSACDVGCGPGTWLSVVQEHGIEDVLGIDGDRVESEDLEIPAERFIVADIPQGLSLERRFDLALCLEIAEHLPREAAADLVRGLVQLAPAVLFSAAIPGQGGVGHVNEQWPDYWAGQFRCFGYLPVDCIRPRVWHEPHVLFAYAQNTILFVEEALLESRPRLGHEYERSKTRPLSIVHPRMLKRAARLSWIEVKGLVEDRDRGLISEPQFQDAIAQRLSPHRRALEAATPDGDSSEQGFEARLRSLDAGLFDHVPSETTWHDRVSLLALQNACRETYPSFQYLEVGSHLGGSLQVLIVDQRCTAITSIDPRPPSLPDARGPDLAYPGNSTERMLAYLRQVPGADLAKLRTVEASTQDIAAAAFEKAAQLCFIDGEHTNDAALRDARFCRQVVGDQGAIVFHDRRLVRGAIEAFIAELDPGSFAAYPLQGSVFVVEFGPPRLLRSEYVARLVPEIGDELVPPPSTD
jgi:SAM-dependent methyltransferase